MTGKWWAHRRSHMKGFTLVELLVAMGIAALMAVIAWRTLDLLIRSRLHAELRAEQVQALRVGLAQWKVDLNHMVDASAWTPWEWDGESLRITRRAARDAGAVVVVTWRLSGDGQRPDTKIWTRSESATIRTLAQWRAVWDASEVRATQGKGADSPSVPASLTAVQDWKLLRYENGEWLPASLHSQAKMKGTSLSKASSPVPETAAPWALRLVLDLPPQSPIHGQVTQDWLNPVLSREAR